MEDIEITPEMIEAGLCELSGRDLGVENLKMIVADIFTSMTLKSQKHL
jgi:hypothetical protein